MITECLYCDTIIKPEDNKEVGISSGICDVCLPFHLEIPYFDIVPKLMTAHKIILGGLR